MRFEKLPKLRFDSTFGVGVIAALLTILQLSKGLDGLEVSLGRLMALYWLGLAIWLVCVIRAIWTERRWWLLLTAPIAFYPAVIAILIIVACAHGNCI